MPHGRTGAAASALFAGAWLWSLARLPERVPTHFAGTGRPDAWADRQAALGTWAFLGLAIAGLFAGLVWFLRRIPAERINVPHPEYCTLLLLAVLQVLIVRASTMADPRPDAWAFVAVGLYLVAVLGRVGWMLTRRYAVPRTDRRVQSDGTTSSSTSATEVIRCTAKVRFSPRRSS